MRKYIVFVLLMMCIACVDKNDESTESDIFIEPAFNELLRNFSVIFIHQDDPDIGTGSYRFDENLAVIFGYGVDYQKIVILKDSIKDDTLTIYFSYVLPDGRQVEPADYYRVTVTKDEVFEVYNKYQAGEIEYYVLKKEREFLGYELPDELEGVELPW
ncbi:MAG: hypothetical protein PQJ61_07615 [Spirochaetales bacterium]|uniref:Uncharacterized protein n=1 Tax=Candidatus Thalassospirochaeta sargassi TaxID=3119039 RepID=A0AAJ1IES6_9SPIO|nr:hypothetical protein [Spirochaetales bacterium]